MITGKKGISLIESAEGFSAKMYKDPVGLPTIGYGTLIDTAAEQWLKTAIIDRTEAEILLRKELTMIERNLGLMLLKPVVQNQFDALVSFTYNLGVANLRISTLLKKANKNPNDPTIRDEFMKWVHGNGDVLPGLVTRRKAEADLYFSK